ncbi:MAG: chromate transporter [Alphaproteobacteria bacterium]|nr:chromate transporter [Alphaproteobacteria bacterium]
MPGDWRNLLALILVFGPLSLFSIGGGASLLAEIEHQSVAVHHWTTHREFADLFAISRAAPGPGTMLSTLIGWKVAGWTGALSATVALYLPSSLVAFGVSKMWGRWRGSPWHGAIERGLAPIAAGLVLAGGLAVLQAAGGAAVWTAAAVSTAILLARPQLNPLILFGASGVLFALVAAFSG